MKEFYRNLKMGVSKEQALRQAQLFLIQQPLKNQSTGVKFDATHPFYWGAFQITGG